MPMLRSLIRVSLVASNVQKTVALPVNTRRIRVRSLSNSSVRFSFVPGEVEVFKGFLTNGTDPLDSGWINNNPTYLYLASPVKGNLVSIEIFSGACNKFQIIEENLLDPDPNTRLS